MCEPAEPRGMGKGLLGSGRMETPVNCGNDRYILDPKLANSSPKQK